MHYHVQGRVLGPGCGVVGEGERTGITRGNASCSERQRMLYNRCGGGAGRTGTATPLVWATPGGCILRERGVPYPLLMTGCRCPHTVGGGVCSPFGSTRLLVAWVVAEGAAQGGGTGREAAAYLYPEGGQV